MSTPTIPQPSYPGGGPYGKMPDFIPLNTGTAGTNYGMGAGAPANGVYANGMPGTGILGAAQNQDIAAQTLMLKNFAQVYPQVQQGQAQYMGLLNPSNVAAGQGLAEQQGAMGWLNNSGNNIGALGAQTTNLAKQFSGATPSSGAMSGALKGLQGISKGQFSNPKLQAAYGTLTGEASGTQPINPIVQQQMMQSGLGNAAQNLAPTSLGTGQTGEAEVAQNFGQSAESYIQNMQNQGLQGLQQLNSVASTPYQNFLNAGQTQANTAGSLYSTAGNLASSAANQYQAAAGIGSNLVQQNNMLEAEQGQMFPKTQIGLSGTDVANMMVSNTMGQNQFNQANFASQMAAAQYNSSINAQNAGLQGSSSSGLVSAGAGIASAAVIAAFCGLAISVLGTTTRQWLSFRHWIHNHAPREFRCAYFRALRKPERYRRSAFIRSAIARISGEFSVPRGWIVPA